MKTLASCLLLAALAGCSNAEAQDKKKSGWEFCRVASKQIRSLKKEMWGFEHAGKSVGGLSLDEFMKKMKLSTKKGLGSKYLRILNHLGAQGWELVTHNVAPDGSRESWMFKRRRR